jgi:hypothetical protein
MLRDSSRLQPCSNFLISKPEIACSRDKKVLYVKNPRWLVSYRASPEGWGAAYKETLPDGPRLGPLG